MTHFPPLTFLACACAITIFLSACSGDASSPENATSTLSPAGHYTISRAVSLAPVPAASTNESAGETSAASSLPADGSSFTLSATSTSSGFDLSFSMPDGTVFSSSSSAAAVAQPSGSHRAFLPGDTIATFALTGPVQGEITVRATSRIDSSVVGGLATNRSTNAVSSAVTTNTAFSASSSSAVTPENASLSASLTFSAFQLTATAPGPSGTIAW